MKSPTVDIPFPIRQHPDSFLLETRTREWAERFGLVNGAAARRKLAAARFGEYAAYTYPTAPWPEAGIAADWLTWAFLIDDQYEEGELGSGGTWRDVIAAIGDVLAGRAPGGPFACLPAVRALADLTGRLYPFATPSWQRRFAAHFTAMMQGAMSEIHLRGTGVPPAPEDYVKLRRDVGAMKVVFDTVEICIRTELTDEMYQDPAYQKIILAGADIVTWTNDLYSVEKEVACGVVTNMVLVLAHHRQMNLPEAAEATHELIRNRVTDLSTAVSLLGNGRARRCAEAVCDWVAGSNHWHAAGTARYR